MSRPMLRAALGIAMTTVILGARAQDTTLDIYWIDVEGGAATLVVTPERRSILMDAGWARSDERDALRIQDAMRDAGVDRALCSLDALNDEEATRADGVADAWPDVAFAVGVHPHQAGAVDEAVGGPAGVAPLVRRAVDARAGVCAIGEIGLDYHYDFAPRETQAEVFRRQIVLARELGRPVVIHTREADADTLDAIRAEGRGDVQGVFHCFTGDAAFARRALDLGFHVSFSGIVTFRNAAAIREAAAIVPADRLLAETDAPYLSPVPYRGRRNEPARVAQVIDALAEVRGVGREVIIEATRRSYAGLFGTEATTRTS